MLETFVNCVTAYGVASTYVKLAVLLYTICYVIEEVLGKYSRFRQTETVRVVKVDANVRLIMIHR